MENENKCPDCNGTGRVKKADGSVQCCFKCLIEGRLNQHSDKIKDSKIRL